MDYFTGQSDVQGEKEYDVLFYGDINNDRRREFIKSIQGEFNVKLINNIFGESLYQELRKGKVVINIHYYEGALLETTRIFECLSNDCLVISEKSTDYSEYSFLDGIVDFVEIGDVKGMSDRIRYWISNDYERELRIRNNRISLNKKIPNWFEYYFMRFLLATENIVFESFYQIAGHNISLKDNLICLGLPEATQRRNYILNIIDKSKVQYFPGLRHKFEWVGCGLSYKFLLRKFQEEEMDDVTIFEDDIEFPDDWEEKHTIVRSYLSTLEGDWDIFSGLIADLHTNVRIHNVKEFDGINFIHIDKLVSTVFNIYNKSIYGVIQEWDENNHSGIGNTIDRFLENKENLRVITTYPFLFGHKEDLSSAIWKHNNLVYRNLILKSQNLLGNKMRAFIGELDNKND